jgi:hypothetical protein
MFSNSSQLPAPESNHMSDGRIDPEWIRVPQVVARFNWSRSKTYELISDGQIKSISLRRRNGVRGIRLVSVDSIRSFLESLANEQASSIGRCAGNAIPRDHDEDAINRSIEEDL